MFIIKTIDGNRYEYTIEDDEEMTPIDQINKGFTFITLIYDDCIKYVNVANIITITMKEVD